MSHQPRPCMWYVCVERTMPLDWAFEYLLLPAVWWKITPVVCDAVRGESQ
jgi:hypothetical protein